MMLLRGEPDEGLEDDVHPNDLGMQWFARRVADTWAEAGIISGS